MSKKTVAANCRQPAEQPANSTRPPTDSGEREENAKRRAAPEATHQHQQLQLSAAGNKRKPAAGNQQQQQASPRRRRATTAGNLQDNPGAQKRIRSSGSSAAGAQNEPEQQAKLAIKREGPQENICAGCLKPIKERYLLVALDKQWHEDCLKCACCDCRLGEVGSSLFTHSGKILCRRDFQRIFGQHGHCAVCKKSIPPYEMVMRANENAYHMDCFACQQCQYRFCVGDRFHLTDKLKIICILCHSDATLAGAAGNQPRSAENAPRPPVPEDENSGGSTGAASPPPAPPPPPALPLPESLDSAKDESFPKSVELTSKQQTTACGT